MKQNDLKASLMTEMEAEIDKLLEMREGGKQLTLTEIEDMVLDVRQRLGQTLTERIVEAQAMEHKPHAPVSSATGKRLESKGKKRQPSRPD